MRAANADGPFFCLFRYLNAIQTMCPHILRYLTTAVITNKDVRKRRQVLKDLVKVIQQVRPIIVSRNDLSVSRGFSRHVIDFLSRRSRTHTRTQSQSLWSVSTSTLTSTVPRRS